MSKLESTYLKGWAVLFMMFLHFGNTFVAPEYQYSWSGNEWEGAFQICVPIFLFLSGYGLMASYMIKRQATFSLLHKEIKRSFKLLKHYWTVTIPFIVLALLLGKFAWSWESLILTASTLRCDWCPNAWFVSLYIELILLFPFFVYLINGKKVVHVVIGFLLIVLATKIIGKTNWVDGSGSIAARQIKMLMNNLPIFIEGMLFAKYGLFSVISHKIRCLDLMKWRCGGAISLLIIVLSIACRAKLPLVSITELFHVPLCILGLKLLASEGSSVFKGLLYVGRYSTTLWFIHGYFCWTFLQPMIYSIRFWPLAFIVFAGISLVVSVILDKLRTFIRC